MKRILVTLIWCIVSVFSWEAVRQYCEPDKDLMAISEVQRELTRRGFPCQIDGVYGPETQAAWKAWERDLLNRSVAVWFTGQDQNE